MNKKNFIDLTLKKAAQKKDISGVVIQSFGCLINVLNKRLL